MCDDSRTRFNRWLGPRLKAARLWRAMSVRTLATSVNMSAGRLRDIESGELSADVIEIERIAAVMRLPVIHFFEDYALCGDTRESREEQPRV